MSRSKLIPAQSVMGWSETPRSAVRIRLRDALPPIAAVMVIAFALIASGAVQPVVTLAVSAGLVMIAMAAIGVAGPGSATPGMLAGASVVALAAVTGLAGPLYNAAPVLAAIFAAGCAWTIGYLSAGKRGVLDLIWTALIWASIAYCAWIFVAHVSTVQGRSAASVADAFETPANAALVFGFLSVIATGRLLHLMKQIDAENLARAEMIERLLRDGLGPLLLLFSSLGCLVLAGSLPGMMFTGAVILAYAWWASLSITTRPHHGISTRTIVIATPMAAIGLAAWGVWQGWMIDDTIAAGIGVSDTLPHLQRMSAYAAAWMESPVTGHGLGSATIEAARFQTLHNAKAMLAPGGAQNFAMSWLVETGVVGLVILLSVIGAIHLRIVSALATRRTPRSFPRMAVAATTLLLLHGVTGSSLNIPALGWMYALVLGCACGLATGHREKTP